MTAPLLAVDKLEVVYQRAITAVQGITLSASEGQIVGILGTNGAGKSTLLRAISGFLRADRGSIALFGEDVTRVPSFRRFEKGLCLVPEGRGIFRSLTVRENLVMQSAKGREKEAMERAEKSDKPVINPMDLD